MEIKSSIKKKKKKGMEAIGVVKFSSMGYLADIEIMSQISWKNTSPLLHFHLN